MLHTSYLLIINYSKSLELTKLQTRFEAEKTQINDLVAQNPFINPKDLAGSIKELQNEFNITNHILIFLTGRYKFSEVFKAFALTDTTGVWLNDIQIANEGEFIGIKGLAVQAALLEKFIGELNSQAIFRHQTFEVHEVDRQVIDKNNKHEYISFYIATNTNLIKA